MTRSNVDGELLKLNLWYWTELTDIAGSTQTIADIRETCVRAIRGLEQELLERLAAKKLRMRTLPNIGSDAAPIRALRLRGKLGHRLDCFDPHHPRGDESSAVVIDDTGRLKVVTASIEGWVRWDDCRDEDLVAEDVRAYLEALRYLMHRNRNVESLGAEADAILAVLDEIKRRG